MQWFYRNWRELGREFSAPGGECLASVGPVCDDLRHPFPVTPEESFAAEGSAKAVRFQNGTRFDWPETVNRAIENGIVIPPGELSGTRAAAGLCAHLGSEWLASCTPSRWVFFGAVATSPYGEWWTRGGIRFSNLHWVIPAPWHGLSLRPQNRSTKFSEKQLVKVRRLRTLPSSIRLFRLW